MKKKSFLLIISGIILISAIVLRIINQGKEEEIINETPELSIIEIEDNDEKEFKEKDISLNISIIQPQNNELITSPYQVKGTASINYLEDVNLYAVLFDENKVALAIAQLKSDEDWFVMDTIPFWADLDFSDSIATSTSQGYLSIRQEENGSLLIDDEIEIININFR